MIVHIRRKEQAAAGGGANSGDKWFENLTKEQQKAYIEQHPNSKYAKNANKYKVTEKTKKRLVVKPSVNEVFRDRVKQLPKEHREFFEKGQDKPNSEERKSIAKHIRTNKHEIVKHIKGQFTEWKDGCGAIGKLASGKKISDHEKKALKGLLIDAAVIAGAITVTGGFAHGAALAMKHVGFDILKDVVLKATIRGTSKAIGTSMGHTGIMAALETVASSEPKPSAKDQLNEKIMLQLVEQMAKFIEKGDIPEDAWDKALKDLERKNKKRK